MPGAQPSLRPAARVAVLDWYAPRARAYAWRRGRPSAYRTLVSELMLQQTQAARVEPLFVAFMERFPTVRALASASRADVLRAWAGLGYNRRAVSLHRAAQVVVAEHGGRVPIDPVVLRTLPGVGPHTAAAVASIAGGQPYSAKEVNVRRVVGRVGFGTAAAPVAAIDEAATRWLDRDDPGAWNQALMDLGREHCRAITALRWMPASSLVPGDARGRSRLDRAPDRRASSRVRCGRLAAGSSTSCGYGGRQERRRSPKRPASAPIASTPRSAAWCATASWRGRAAPSARRRLTDPYGIRYG